MTFVYEALIMATFLHIQLKRMFDCYLLSGFNYIVHSSLMLSEIEVRSFLYAWTCAKLHISFCWLNCDFKFKWLRSACKCVKHATSLYDHFINYFCNFVWRKFYHHLIFVRYLDLLLLLIKTHNWNDSFPFSFLWKRKKRNIKKGISPLVVNHNKIKNMKNTAQYLENLPAFLSLLEIQSTSIC